MVRSRNSDPPTFHQDIMPCLRTFMRYIFDDLSQLREILRLDRTVDPLQDSFSTLASAHVSTAAVACRHVLPGNG